MAEEVQVSFQQIVSMLQNERQSLAAIEEQLSELQATLEETLTTKGALSELEKQKKSVNALMHLGTGVYVKADIAEPNAVFLTLGGGIVTGSTIENAKAALDNREKEVRQQLSELFESRQKASSNLNELTRAVKEMQAKEAGQQR